MPRKAKKPVPIRALRSTRKQVSGVAGAISPTAARQIERRFKVLELRRHGYGLEEIGETLGVAVSTVREDLAQVLSKTAQGLMETTEEWREMEINRLQALLRRYQPLAEQGNLAAAGMVMAISRDLRKMLAIDKPEEKKTEETGVRVYVGVDVDLV